MFTDAAAAFGLFFNRKRIYLCDDSTMGRLFDKRALWNPSRCRPKTIILQLSFITSFFLFSLRGDVKGNEALRDGERAAVLGLDQQRHGFFVGFFVE